MVYSRHLTIGLKQKSNNYDSTIMSIILLHEKNQLVNSEYTRSIINNKTMKYHKILFIQ